MMKLVKVHFEDRAALYLMSGRATMPSEVWLEKTPEVTRLDRQSQREVFLYREINALVKVKLDKHTFRSNPVRWLGRVLMQERLFLQLDSRKEYRGNEIYIAAGLEPVQAYAWGVAINPFNAFGSIYVMDFCHAAVNGAEYFRQSSNSKKSELIRKLCAGVAALARLGYYNRDQHFGNVLIDGDERFIWIDTHVYRLPLWKRRRMRTAVESAARKMPDEQSGRLLREILADAQVDR